MASLGVIYTGRRLEQTSEYLRKRQAFHCKCTCQRTQTTRLDTENLCSIISLTADNTSQTSQSSFTLAFQLFHLEDPDGIDVSGARLPATEKDDSGAFPDVALSATLGDPGKDPALHVLRPVVLEGRIREDQRVDPTMEVALREGEGGKSEGHESDPTPRRPLRLSDLCEN